MLRKPFIFNVNFKIFPILTVPKSGNMKPAPILARTSLMGTTKPLGSPFLAGSWDRDK